MMRKRFKKLKRSKIFWLLALYFSYKLLRTIIDLFETTLNTLTASSYWKSGLIQTSCISIPLLIVSVYVLLHLKKRKTLSAVEISDDQNDYVICDEDYKRSTPKEAEYRKKYLLSLLRLYDNKCAKCGAMDNGLDLDHFVFSKSCGGNFSMLHTKGYWVNNAIPLCRHCNRSKSDRSYKTFFSETERLELFTKNKEMTLLINKGS